MAGRGKADKKSSVRIAVYLPAALARRLRVRCAEGSGSGSGWTLSSAVEAAVREWLVRERRI